MEKSKIFVIVQADGDLYCAADSHEHAQAIIDEDTAGGSVDLSGAFIVELNLWSKSSQD